MNFTDGKRGEPAVSWWLLLATPLPTARTMNHAMRLMTLTVLIALQPEMALAHPGPAGAAGFAQGLLHPVSGPDHLLAMVAVGLWASQARGRTTWAIPCGFLVAMVLGGGLGIAGVPVPYVEEGILASVLVFGLLAAGACRLPLSWSVPAVGLFAGLHGHAHGVEMPAAIGAGPYMVGFVAATALLHGAGLGLGALVPGNDREIVTRVAGGVVVLAGLCLALA